MVGVAWLLQAAPAPRPAFTSTALTSPAAATGSGEPRLTIEGDRAILSWIEEKNDRATLKFSERSTTGWSKPIDVVSNKAQMVA